VMFEMGFWRFQAVHLPTMLQAAKREHIHSYLHPTNTRQSPF
jgi:hypothetical protein